MSSSSGTKFEESEDSVTPLESAMTVLENICAELEVPQSDLERFHTSLREMVRSHTHSNNQ